MSVLDLLQRKPDLAIDQEKLTNLGKAFISALKSVDLNKATNIATQIRVLAEQDVDKKMLIQSGIISSVAAATGPEYCHHESLLAECTWILCNIAAGDSQDVAYLVDIGALHRGLELIRHPCYEVQENILFLLANLAADSIVYRDMLLNEGVADQIEWLLQSNVPQTSFISKVTWLISNLTRGRPYPSFEKVAIFPKYLEYIMKNTQDTDTLIHSLWALSYLSDGDDEQLKVVSELDIWTKVFHLAKIKQYPMLAAAIRLINNIAAGDDDQAEMLLQNDVLEIYGELLTDPKKIIRKETYFGLSNFLANGSVRIQQVFDFKQGEIIQRLINAPSLESFDVARECIYCIRHICLDGNTLQLYQLISLGVIDLLVKILREGSEENILIACLESLQGILDKFKKEPEFEKLQRTDVISLIYKCGGVEVLQDLQSHHSPRIYKLVDDIIEGHYDYGIDGYM